MDEGVCAAAILYGAGFRGSITQVITPSAGSESDRSGNRAQSARTCNDCEAGFAGDRLRGSYRPSPSKL